MRRKLGLGEGTCYSGRALFVKMCSCMNKLDIHITKTLFKMVFFILTLILTDHYFFILRYGSSKIKTETQIVKCCTKICIHISELKGCRQDSLTLP